MLTEKKLFKIVKSKMFAHSRSAESAIADCLPPHYLVPVLKTVVFAESLLT